MVVCKPLKMAEPLVWLMSGVISLCIMLSATLAYADHDQVVRVQFVGWSATSQDTYLVRLIDEDRGNRLEIREVGKPTAIMSVGTTPSTVNRVLESEQFANWSFTVLPSKGLSAPNGWRLSGQEAGVSLNINLSNGKGIVVLGNTRLKPTGSGAFAEARISEAYWSADSSRVVLVVTHSKSGAWGLDVDEAYGFKLNSSGESEKPVKTDDKADKKKSTKKKP